MLKVLKEVTKSFAISLNFKNIQKYFATITNMLAFNNINHIADNLFELH